MKKRVNITGANASVILKRHSLILNSFILCVCVFTKESSFGCFNKLLAKYSSHSKTMPDSPTRYRSTEFPRVEEGWESHPYNHYFE